MRPRFNPLLVTDTQPQNAASRRGLRAARVNVMHHDGSPMPTSRFQAITTQAWTGMLAILLMMFLVDLERFAMLGQYKELSESLAQDPGARGLLVLVCLVCLNVLMQIAIRTFSAQWFRVATVWLTVAYALFFLLHQVVHVAGGESLGIHTPLDLTHHLLGVWGSWSAWRWSKDA